MATAEDNLTLSTEVANVLLTKISRSAETTETSSYLKELAEAYATVREAMPKKQGTRAGQIS